MRTLIVGALLLVSCANPVAVEKTRAPDAPDAREVAARAGFLLDQVAKADERTETCERDRKAAVSALEHELELARRRVSELEGALAGRDQAILGLQATLNDAQSLARQRGQQVVKAFSGCHAASDAVSKLTEERDSCYMRLATK